ncbi:hypothetical protein AMAG_08557 [Allomyces macrogynus ATCC 38327]|uniref:CST complex subunit CTC1 n=1 Tax=Allomyces macrogynus (strain ATCC 38327) TaxID=578462 RepID=A0A0L0SM13_ALLM3|nr:hypothetical protein AMAG_08557 [Allomyces macrogynus ATCC 38327]|eukprot:KNE63425.1 hypothetical protein AMAG_08557 [Allomyces macrogynus ATCC 38327]
MFNGPNLRQEHSRKRKMPSPSHGRARVPLAGSHDNNVGLSISSTNASTPASSSDHESRPPPANAPSRPPKIPRTVSDPLAKLFPVTALVNLVDAHVARGAAMPSTIATTGILRAQCAIPATSRTPGGMLLHLSAADADDPVLMVYVPRKYWASLDMMLLVNLDTHLVLTRVQFRQESTAEGADPLRYWRVAKGCKALNGDMVMARALTLSKASHSFPLERPMLTQPRTVYSSQALMRACLSQEIVSGTGVTVPVEKRAYPDLFRGRIASSALECPDQLPLTLFSQGTPPTEWIAPPLISYRGTMTHCIDARLALYDLDHDFLLCLFYVAPDHADTNGSPWDHQLPPNLPVDVILSNVHVVHVPPAHLPPTVRDAFGVAEGGPPVVMLVSCAYATVAWHDAAKQPDPPPPLSPDAYTALYNVVAPLPALLGLASIADLLAARYPEFAAHLPLDAVKWLWSRIATPHPIVLAHRRHRVLECMEHPGFCSLLAMPVAEEGVPEWPDAPSRRLVSLADAVELRAPQAVLVGVVECHVGRLYLMDTIAAVRIVGTLPPDVVGALVLVEDMTWAPLTDQGAGDAVALIIDRVTVLARAPASVSDAASPATWYIQVERIIRANRTVVVTARGNPIDPGTMRVALDLDVRIVGLDPWLGTLAIGELYLVDAQSSAQLGTSWSLTGITSVALATPASPQLVDWSGTPLQLPGLTVPVSPPPRSGTTAIATLLDAPVLSHVAVAGTVRAVHARGSDVAVTLVDGVNPIVVILARTDLRTPLTVGTHIVVHGLACVTGGTVVRLARTHETWVDMRSGPSLEPEIRASQMHGHAATPRGIINAAAASRAAHALAGQHAFHAAVHTTLATAPPQSTAQVVARIDAVKSATAHVQCTMCGATVHARRCACPAPQRTNWMPQCRVVLTVADAAARADAVVADWDVLTTLVGGGDAVRARLAENGPGDVEVVVANARDVAATGWRRKREPVPRHAPGALVIDARTRWVLAVARETRGAERFVVRAAARVGVPASGPGTAGTSARAVAWQVLAAVVSDGVVGP